MIIFLELTNPPPPLKAFILPRSCVATVYFYFDSDAAALAGAGGGGGKHQFTKVCFAQVKTLICKLNSTLSVADVNETLKFDVERE